MLYTQTYIPNPEVLNPEWNENETWMKQMKQQSQKKQQKVGEGSSSLQKHLLGSLTYPLKKKNLTAITMAIFAGQISSK